MKPPRPDFEWDRLNDGELPLGELQRIDDAASRPVDEQGGAAGDSVAQPGMDGALTPNAVQGVWARITGFYPDYATAGPLYTFERITTSNNEHSHDDDDLTGVALEVNGQLGVEAGAVVQVFPSEDDLEGAAAEKWRFVGPPPCPDPAVVALGSGGGDYLGYANAYSFAGSAPGDLLLFVVTPDDDTDSVTPPLGLTELYHDRVNGKRDLYVGWRRSTAGDGEFYVFASALTINNLLIQGFAIRYSEDPDAGLRLNVLEETRRVPWAAHASFLLPASLVLSVLACEKSFNGAVTLPQSRGVRPYGGPMIHQDLPAANGIGADVRVLAPVSGGNHFGAEECDSVIESPDVTDYVALTLGLLPACRVEFTPDAGAIYTPYGVLPTALRATIAANSGSGEIDGTYDLTWVEPTLGSYGWEYYSDDGMGTVLIIAVGFQGDSLIVQVDYTVPGPVGDAVTGTVPAGTLPQTVVGLGPFSALLTPGTIDVTVSL